MDTLVTRKQQTNFTILLNGQMSCNGLSNVINVIFDDFKQLLFYYAKEVDSYVAVQNNLS